jgi:ribonuclease E
LDPQGNPIVERGQEGGSQSFGEGHPDAEAAGEHGDSADAFNRREEPELPHDDEHRGNTVPPEPVGDETVGTNSERLETIFDNEDAESDAHEAAAAAGESAPASDETPEAPSEEGAPKKRRRRRGGRRHRRRGEGTAGEAAAEGDEDSAEAEATPPAEVDEAPAETPAPEPVAEVTEEAPAKAPRRRRAAAAAKPRKTAKPSRKAPAASAAPTPEPVATPVVRSGSTDRHLVLDDIPVDPEPVRRPRSARDLDAVPDDFD